MAVDLSMLSLIYRRYYGADAMRQSDIDLPRIAARHGLEVEAIGREHVRLRLQQRRYDIEKRSFSLPLVDFTEEALALQAKHMRTHAAIDVVTRLAGEGFELKECDDSLLTELEALAIKLMGLVDDEMRSRRA